MRRLSLLLLFLAALAFAAFAWPTRWRYDHITVDRESYLVRIDRLSGHADILVPELGWTPAEAPWDAPETPNTDQQTSVDPL